VVLAGVLVGFDLHPSRTGLTLFNTIYAGTMHLGDYMSRWVIELWDGRSLRLHHIKQSDKARSLHDHPWEYWSFLLTGGYTEHTAMGSTYLPRFSLVRRYAEQTHRLELTDGPVWTLVWTGPKRKPWGFIVENNWIPWRDAPSEWSFT
jgi:hypothetical protein